MASHITFPKPIILFYDCNREAPETKSNGSHLIKRLIDWTESVMNSQTPSFCQCQTWGMEVEMVNPEKLVAEPIREPRSSACPFLRLDPSYKYSHGEKRILVQRHIPGEFLWKMPGMGLFMSHFSGLALSFHAKAEASGPKGWRAVEEGQCGSMCHTVPPPYISV